MRGKPERSFVTYCDERVDLCGAPGGPEGPTRSTFLTSFVRAEIGPFPAGPALNETAPDFTLSLVHSQEEVTLSKLVGPRLARNSVAVKLPSSFGSAINM